MIILETYISLNIFNIFSQYLQDVLRVLYLYIKFTVSFTRKNVFKLIRVLYFQSFFYL